jgi:uncharacterized protein (DUF1330 family)
MPKCYFLAHIDIVDEAEYKKYLDGTDSVFVKFQGKYLAVDTNPETLEGEPACGRTVIIEFPDEVELRRWYDSPEYQCILRHRLKAARCTATIVHGL